MLHKIIKAIKKLSPRGWAWSKFEKNYVKSNSVCLACGATTSLEVHHKIPYAMRPDLEFEPTNLVTLCMSTNKCHFRLGHGSYWSAFTPSINLDLQDIKKGAITLQQAFERAKMNRVKF